MKQRMNSIENYKDDLIISKNFGVIFQRSILLIYVLFSTGELGSTKIKIF